MGKAKRKPKPIKLSFLAETKFGVIYFEELPVNRLAEALKQLRSQLRQLETEERENREGSV